jgi:hypothetical protein
MNWRKLKSKLSLLCLLTALCLKSTLLSAQSGQIKGQVVNGEDHSPLPFAHILFSSGNKGTISNIDGYFSVPDTLEYLKVSFVGFKPTIINDLSDQPKNLIVEMFPTGVELAEIKILPGKNPVLELMKKVTDNIKANDPANLNSFQYTAYHKFWLSAEAPDQSGKKTKSALTEKEKQNIEQKLDSSHLFLMETLYRKKFLQPNHENEEILNSKVSGLEQESFFLLATQLQSFSIYNEYLTLLNRKYLSPVSKTALNNYFYSILDTLITGDIDTTFILRYHPLKENHINGLKGVLHISNKGYAIQSVIAEPLDGNLSKMTAVFKQQYDLLPSGNWFPGELDAEIHFAMKDLTAKDSLTRVRKLYDLEITANSKTFITQREINIPLSPKDFTKYRTTISEGVKDSTQNLSQYRYEPLTAKDSMTYYMLDSLGKAADLDRKIKFYNKLAQGKIPVGFIDLDYNYLFGYNIYEGYKIGLGAETNKKLSKYFTLGGYVVYGINDKEIRYGDWLNVFPTGHKDFKLTASYRDMKLEFGGSEFLEKSSLFNSEYNRNLLVSNMYRSQRFSFSAEFRPIQPLNLRSFADVSDNSLSSPENVESTKIWERVSRIGFQMRYSPGVSFLNDPDILIETSSPRSDWFLTIIQGINLFNSAYSYTKMEFKGKFNYTLANLGNTAIMLRAGKIFNDSPLTELFNGYGSYSSEFTLSAPYSFATMRMNEFSAQQYSAIHIRHNFSPVIIPSGKKFNPELVLAQNIGFGSLNNTYDGQLKDFSKGYFETGIETNKLIKFKMISCGLGIYYRYGPYSLDREHYNFAYKFSIDFKM